MVTLSLMGVVKTPSAVVSAASEAAHPPEGAEVPSMYSKISADSETAVTSSSAKKLITLPRLACQSWRSHGCRRAEALQAAVFAPAEIGGLRQTVALD